MCTKLLRLPTIAKRRCSAMTNSNTKRHLTIVTTAPPALVFGDGCSKMASVLTNEDVASLIFLWHEYEAAIGIRSTFSDEAEVKKTKDFNEPGFDPFNDVVLHHIKRATAISRTLQRMV